MSGRRACAGAEAPTCGSWLASAVVGDRHWSSGVAVFVDESAEHVDSFDTPDVVYTGGCRLCRRGGHVKVDAAVGPGGVVVRDVVGQDTFEVAAVADQHPVEAFGAHGANPALGVRVGPRRQLHPVRTIDAGGCG
jgi:hypothetical protein